MAVQIVRFMAGDGARWGVHRNGLIAPLAQDWPTTRSFFEQGGPAAAHALSWPAKPLHRDEVALLSPVTRDGDYICQATNYASHLREIGRDPQSQTVNVFFMKASSCIVPADADVVKPAHVQLLDYEVELGLVIGKAIDGPVEVTRDNLHEYIGGWVMTNDISAREIQVSHEQFHKAKSYRTFGPTGPFLVLPSPEESRRWGELVLSLWVNGERRQHAPAREMLFDPVRTLRELATIRDLAPGDMIATGTPAGVALKVPGKLLMTIGKLLSPAARYRAFLRGQMRNERYLKPGDVVTAEIASADGTLHLGTQANHIR